MGNYIDFNPAKQNALKLIAEYMTRKVDKNFWNDGSREVAIDICKEAFIRVNNDNDSPIEVLENLLDEIELYSDSTDERSRCNYYTRTEVVNNILNLMS